MAADVLQLTDGTTTLNLLAATSYRTRANWTLVEPPPEITWAGSRYRDGQYPAATHRPNRTIEIPCILAGTSADNLYANITAASLMINEATRYWISGGAQGKRAYLRFTPDSATNQIQYDVLSGVVQPGRLPSPHLRSGGAAAMPGGVITLTCSPWGELNAADINYGSNNLANDGPTITTIAVPGEAEVPIGLIASPDQTLNTTPRVIVARRTRGTVANFRHKLQAEDGAGTGFTATALTPAGVTYATLGDGTASGGNKGRWTFTSNSALVILREAITANYTDHYGDFRVMLRLKVDAGFSGGTALLHYGAQNSPTRVTTAVSLNAIGTSWSFLDLGVIHWPGLQVPADVVVSTLVFELTIETANAHWIDLDYFRLFPVDESYIDLTPSAALTAGYKVVANGRAWPPARYVTDGSNNLLAAITLAQAGSYLKMAPGVNLWILYCNDTAADVLDDTSDWTLNTRERFGFIRGA